MADNCKVQYIDLRVVHIKGSDNHVVDALSCNRLHRVGSVQWEKLPEDINVVFIFVGLPKNVHSLLQDALDRNQQGLRPHTVYQYKNSSDCSWHLSSLVMLP